MAVSTTDEVTSRDWPLDIYNALKEARVSQLCYVPDAGHSRLIQLSHADRDIKTTVLTTEEEGVALAAGAWQTAIAALAIRMAAGIITAAAVLGDRRILLDFLLIPARDLWGVVVWAGGLFGDTVEWRDKKLKLSRDGKIRPA